VRVAVVDIGTNSTRLLIADVEDGRIAERDRRTRVTLLGAGVDATGALAPDARERVLAVLDEYAAAIEAAGCDARTAVLTSAVRDAANGPQFTAEVARRYGLETRTLDGDAEAALTFLCATADRDPLDATAERDPDGATATLVIDVGGGSTELVVGGVGRPPDFHVSTQAGVVRQTERHLHDDPPAPAQLQALAAEVRALFAAAVPAPVRRAAQLAIAVAGTATSCAAIAQALEPYDPARVHGYVLEVGELELLLARLAQLPLARRRDVTGLHPDRAPTIVAGIVILLEALRTFGLDRCEVSEHDILWGAALARARDAAASAG
jgi:exopolyphosphatase/guanosine-5'-triphosphate,3'-diphosphate pyrophosphatase